MMETDYLNHSSFAVSPLWTWNSGMDGYVSLNCTDEEIDENYPYFISSEFSNGQNWTVPGYVVGGVGSYHAFRLFIGSEEVGFNRTSKTLWLEGLERVSSIVGDPSFTLFPLFFRLNVLHPELTPSTGWFEIEGEKLLLKK